MLEPRPKALTVLAAVFVLTAAGIALFWVNWFASGAYLTEGDESYRAFENAFPLPDGVLSLLLVACAIRLLLRSPDAFANGLMAAGMLWFLASLDTLYNLQHGGFTDFSDPETHLKLFISAYCYALGGITVFYLWKHRHRLVPGKEEASTEDAPATRRAIGFIMLVILLCLAAVWFPLFRLLCYKSHHPASVGAGSIQAFFSALPLAESVLALTAVLAVAGILLRRSWGLLWSCVTCGGAIFATLIHLSSFSIHEATTDVHGWSVSQGLPFASLALLWGILSLAWSRRADFLEWETGRRETCQDNMRRGS